MGANMSNLKAGDSVKIGIDDMRLIKQMQQSHGGWNIGMEECLVGPCILVQGIGTDAVVRAPSGNVYRLNAELLVKCNSGDEYEIGNIVEIIKNEEIFKLFCGGVLKDSIKDIIGKNVEINQRLPDGNYKVKYNNIVYTINPKCIAGKVEDSPEIIEKTRKEGDKVVLINDCGEMKKLQEGHGGWSDLMNIIKGQEVVIVKIFDDGDMYISKFGMEWLINPRCIENLNRKSKTRDEKFKKGDIVRISSDIAKTKELQQFHGGWINVMKLHAGKNGKVEAIMPTGDVKVNINGMGIVYNPKLLSKINDGDSKIKKVGTKKVSPGDKVRLISDRNKVKKLQKNHGEWTDSMKMFLGKSGTVKSLFPDGDLRVKIMGTKVTLNPECVELTDTESDSEPDIMNLLANMSQIMTGGISDNSDNESDVEVPEAMNEQEMRFFRALKSGDKTQVQNLVDLVGPNTHRMKIYPLMIATNEGHDDIVRLLIDKSADLNSRDTDGDTALHVAVQKVRYNICKLLINRGADINAQNNKKVTPIMIAALTGSQDILKLLVNTENADLNIGDYDNDTALHLAIQNSRVDSVETLLDAGANIKTVNKKQFNAFHLAALRGHEKILETFLKREGAAIVDMQKEDKFAAIHLVAINNHPGCMNILINYNADVNIRNIQLQTALHIAVSQRYMECVKILVINNAEINLKDDSGDTPLHNAIRAHQMERLKSASDLFGLGAMFRVMEGIQNASDDPEEIIMYLIEKGAKLDIKNNEGKTPIDCCGDESLKAKLNNMAPEKYRPINVKTPISVLSPNPAVTVTPVVTAAPVVIPEPVVRPNVERTRDEELAELRRVIQEMEDEKTCIICRDRRINITFGCGHMTCDVCANNLFECHICRKNIDKKIRIYE